MRNPGTPGGGITGAWISSLGGDRSKSLIADHASRFNHFSAAVLDREADFLLSVGRHASAERLAHVAAGLREGLQ